jgi:hypothetical protein
MRLERSLRTSVTTGEVRRTVSRTAKLTIDHIWSLAAVAVPTGLELMGRMHTVDLAYHLRAGAQILSRGAVPRLDTYTFTVSGDAWLDQQWGAQLLLALVHRVGGWTGLALLLGVLVAATFSLLWFACRAKGASRRAASLLTLGAFSLSFLSFSTRPQTFALPLFAACLWIVARSRKHPRSLWLLPAIAALWANLHGSFVLAPVLTGMAWLENRSQGGGVARETRGIALATLVATLLNPFGVGVWRYAFALATNQTILTDIAEWSAPSLRTASGTLFFLSGIAVAGYLARRRGSAETIDLLWLGGFFLLGLSSLRMMTWWGLCAPVVLAGMMLAPSRHEPVRTGSATANRLLGAALIALIVVQLPWWRNGSDPVSGASMLLLEAPQHLADAAEETLPASSRLFVTEYWASWIEFAVPSMPVFVDSRIELFPDRVWSDYVDVIEGKATWPSVLDRWHVDGVLLRHGDILLPLIGHDPGWRLAYRDSMGALFVRA